jgi:hypothetical protein
VGAAHGDNYFYFFSNHWQNESTDVAIVQALEFAEDESNGVNSTNPEKQEMRQ